MPYSKCPICGNVSHVNVADPKAWYAERYPDLPFMAMVAAPCFDCFAELAVGDTVEIHRHITKHPEWASPGATGKIRRITSSEHCSIYHVDVQDGKGTYFVRGEIRKPS